MNRKFPTRVAAEDWLKAVHGIDNATIIDLPAARAAVAERNAALAASAPPSSATPVPAETPAAPAPAPAPASSLALPVPASPEGIAQLLQVLHQHFGDPLFRASVANLAIPPQPSSTPEPAASATRGSAGLSVPSSSPNVPAFNARRTSNDDVTQCPPSIDIKDRFLNVLPAMARLVEIFDNGNVAMITEITIPTPSATDSDSDEAEWYSGSTKKIDLEGAYNLAKLKSPGPLKLKLPEGYEEFVKDDYDVPTGITQGPHLAEEDNDSDWETL
ncbi:hypothetical protein IL306_004341 [Fusarium sp. DS 682]|nr:hypothetical protein IL306_004341 [Fusarium sp. DS 682]